MPRPPQIADMHLVAALLIGCPSEPAQPKLPALPPEIVAVPDAPLGAPQPLRELTIAFTGEVRGEIEPCGCPTVPYGGFRRRAHFLDELRDEGLPTFVLDAGEMLVKGQIADRSDDRKRRARAVLDLARSTGLDAWTASASDLSVDGITFLQEGGALAANWLDASGTAPLARTKIAERGGVRLGIVGVADTPGADLHADIAVGSVAAAIQHAEATAGAPDLWVALSSADYATNMSVAEGVAGLGAVLSISGDELSPPIATKGAPIIETADRGRFVHVVRIALATDRGPLHVVTSGPLKTAADGRRQFGAADPEARKGFAARMASLPNVIAGAARGRNLAYVDAQPLGSELDADGAADGALEAFRAETQRNAQLNVRSGPKGDHFATTTSCAGCHADRLAAWAFDDHARAYEALLTRKAGTSTECVGCHTTGFGRPGGYAALDTATLRTYKAVQCEACHGPMGGHPQNEKVQARTVDETTCLTCHDKANSPQFDYTAYLKRISCSRIKAPDAGNSATP